MKKTTVMIALLVSFCQSAHCQNPKVVQVTSYLLYASVQGSWDLDKNPTRSQFGGNNVLLNTYFANSGPTLHRSMSWSKNHEGLGYFSELGEVSFKVTEDGKIDSIKIIKSISDTCDTTITNLIKATDGKWRPGQVDGKRIAETITLWYSMYIGPRINEYPLDQCLVKAFSAFEKNKPDKALELVNTALQYDRLNIAAIKLKAQILDRLGKSQEACEWIKDNYKYNYKKLGEDQALFCK